MFRGNFVPGDQKLYGQLGVFQPPHRIQTRRKDETDFLSGDCFLGAAADLHQFTQSRKGSGLHGLHAPLDQGAVLILQRNDVRHRTQRHQFCILFPQGRIRIAQPLKRLADLKGHAHAGQPFKRISAVQLLGIDNGKSHGQNFRRAVMVGNNDIHPPGRFRHFLHAADTAVHRNDQRDAFLMKRLQRVPVQAVTLPFPFGDIGADIGIQAG